MSPCPELYLDNNKPMFLHALQLMMMYHHTKCGNKMFGSLEDIFWTHIQ